MYEYGIQKMRMNIVRLNYKLGKLEMRFSSTVSWCFYLSVKKTNKAITCPNTIIC